MGETMDTFEKNLEKLERLTQDIKRTDIPLEDALRDIEEGIRLAAGMEKELDRIEGKIQILMNEPVPMDPANPPQLDLFGGADPSTGTAGAPETGTRR